MPSSAPDTEAGPDINANRIIPDGYHARDAIAQLPVGTKFIGTPDLADYLSQRWNPYTTVYTMLEGNQYSHTFEANDQSPTVRHINSIYSSFLYTVIESAEGEVYYALAE